MAKGGEAVDALVRADIEEGLLGACQHLDQRELRLRCVGGGVGPHTLGRLGEHVRDRLVGPGRHADRDVALGPAAELYRTGKSGALMRAGRILAAGGAAATLFGRRNRAVSALSGAALLTGSAVTRFGVFEAGRASVRDPKYTVGPQRERLRERSEPPGDPPS